MKPRILRCGLETDADIADVLPVLIGRLLQIAAVTIQEIRVPPSLQNRVRPLPELTPLVNTALQLRKTYDFPFWDALLLTAEREQNAVAEEILDGAGFHQPMTSAVHTKSLTAESLTSRTLVQYAEKIGDGNIAVISSRVKLHNGMEAHLPLLDFSLPPSSANDKIVERIVVRLGQGGYLLNSGNSYHFYGDELLNDTGYRKFLGAALLFSPLVDHRWIAHQLVEGAGALRISAGKNGFGLPRLVAEIHETNE
jgi:hypothetical protein